MIKGFFIEGFKSFAEPTYTNIDDLLVIAGTNSSGKSTLIQALLLLSQTLDNPRTDVTLDLGGKYIQFAEFREIACNRPKTRDASFTIGFNLEIKETDYYNIKLLDLREIYYALPSRRRAISTETPSAINNIKIRITFSADRYGTPIISSATYEKTISNMGQIKVELGKFGKKYKSNLEIVPNLKYSIKADELLLKLEGLARKSSEGKRTVIRAPFRYWDDIYTQYGFHLEDIPDIGNAVNSYFSDENLRFLRIADDDIDILSEILKDILNYTYHHGLSLSEMQPIPFDHFLIPTSYRYPGTSFTTQRYIELLASIFGDSLREIRRYLRSIEYIGPLRAKPERAYLSTGTPVEIGNAGENAVPILWLNQNEKVKCKTRIGEEFSERILVKSVQDWLQEFGIAYSFHITKPKRVIYQAELESSQGSNTMVTIADVGFGVSQLLPVIVAGLITREGSTLILEQPEIHLHPKLQGKLADFLICMVELGKKVIVETHSEHLINMLRLRVAQDKSGSLQKKIGIIFVRNWQQIPAIQRQKEDKNKRGSYIESLRVDEYGKIINWPADFFPEATNLNEEILKAMMDKYPGSV
jgi:predicted ATPase